MPSAPALHNALSTASMSCWCTTRSSGEASRGKRPSASRCASLSVTTSPGPRIGSNPASTASLFERLVIAASAASAPADPATAGDTVSSCEQQPREHAHHRHAEPPGGTTGLPRTLGRLGHLLLSRNSWLGHACVRLVVTSSHRVTPTVREGTNAQVQSSQEERLHRQPGEPDAGQGQDRAVERLVRGAVLWLDADRLGVAACVPARVQPDLVPGRSWSVELRHRICFHDHRLVAHDEVALAVPGTGMNSTWTPRVTRLATSPPSDH